MFSGVAQANEEYFFEHKIPYADGGGEWLIRGVNVRGKKDPYCSAQNFAGTGDRVALFAVSIQLKQQTTNIFVGSKTNHNLPSKETKETRTAILSFEKNDEVVKSYSMPFVRADDDEDFIMARDVNHTKVFDALTMSDTLKIITPAAKGGLLFSMESSNEVINALAECWQTAIDSGLVRKKK